MVGHPTSEKWPLGLLVMNDLEKKITWNNEDKNTERSGLVLRDNRKNCCYITHITILLNHCSYIILKLRKEIPYFFTDTS